MSAPFNCLKMNDAVEDYRVSKENMFDLPMKLLIVGKSQLSGKTNLVSNLALRPWDNNDKTGRECYMNDFLPYNIYVVCPSTGLDPKWAQILKLKQIPDGNLYTSYNEEELDQLYEKLVNDYREAVDAGRKPTHKLIIMDDCSFSGALKDKISGVLTRIFCNGRHALISVWCTAQKYSQILTTARENATGLILYECSNKQLDLIMEDHCSIPKKDFIKIFRETTKERHSYMAINYSNHVDNRFLDSTFKPIALLEKARKRE
jgi:hypothetical protein